MGENLGFGVSLPLSLQLANHVAMMEPLQPPFFFKTYKKRIMIPPTPLSWWEGSGHHECPAHSPCHEYFCSRNKLGWLGQAFQIRVFRKMPPKGMWWKEKGRDVLCWYLALPPKGWMTVGRSGSFSKSIHRTLSVKWVDRSRAVISKHSDAFWMSRK